LEKTRVKKSKPKIVITGDDPDYGCVHLLLGSLVGIAATFLIWMITIFGLVYPFTYLFQPNSDPIPIPIWYGSWVITMLIVYVLFIWQRRVVPLFAGASIFFSCLTSVALLLILWLGAELM
jgi:hypothetical protein